MRVLIAAVVTLLAAVPAWSQVTGRVVQVESDIETFDPAMFVPGPNIDVWHLVLQNDFDHDVTSLTLDLLGPWQNFVLGGLGFKDDPELPMLGPNTVAESFFVLPAGGIFVVSPVEEYNGGMSLSVAVAGSQPPLVPANGEMVTAVMSVLTGTTFDIGEFTGQAAVNGAFEPIRFVPEPSAALLLTAALGGLAPTRCPRRLVQGTVA